MGCFLCCCFPEVTAVEDRYKDNDKDPSSHKTITLKESATHRDHNHEHNHDRGDNRDRSHEHTKLSRAPSGSSDKSKSRTPCEEKKDTGVEDGDKLFIAAQTFTYRELAAATKYFRTECVLGEGGFGRVYKGFLESTGQTVAVKQLDRNGLQGNREFLVEVLMLSMLHHPNLVNLIGYCADGDQRILVYEYMPNGSLEDHLHDLPPGKESLDWNTRMKIAAGAAKGLEYLHEKANPPVIYRDFKSPNILLDEMFRPKLSDFGLAKLGPIGDKSHVSTRVMGTYGYCAPEYARTGQLTLKSDVYSFGVVLLELITGRKAIDYSKSVGEQNLVAWAHPLFKERRKFPQMADPLLKGRFPMKGFCQALAVAAMCLQDEGSARPGIGDVVTALSYLTSQAYDPGVAQPVPVNRREKKEKEKEKDKDMNLNAEVQEFEDKGLDSPQVPSIKEPTKTRATTDRTTTMPSSVKKKECSDDDSDNINAQNSSETEQKDKKLADRERAVAEARNWGANWREKMRGS